MKEVCWNSQENFPENKEKSWVVIHSNGSMERGEAKVRRSMRNWQPISMDIVGTPTSDFIKPAICIPDLANDVVKIYRKKAASAIACWIAMFCFFLLILYRRSGSLSAHADLVAAFIGFILFASIDNFYIIRSVNSMSERALYMRWLQKDLRIRRGALLLGVLGAIIGLTQYGVQGWTSNVSLAIDAYGLDFAKVRSGDWWLFMTGPYAHISLVHYIGNYSLLMFIGPVVYAYEGWKTLAIFAFSNFLTAIYIFYFHQAGIVGYAGMSGGVFALFGWIAGHSIIFRRRFPRGWWFVISGIAFLTVMAANALQPQASSAAHALGFSLGLLASVVFHFPWRGLISPDPQP